MFRRLPHSGRVHRHSSSPKQAQKGLTVVEMAIVAQVFFLVLLAIMDGGRMIYTYGALAHVAREGVRYAVVRGAEAGEDNRRSGDAPATTAQIKSYMQQRSTLLPNLIVTTSWPEDENQQPNQNAGQVFEILVEHNFVPVTPFLPSILLTSASSTVIYF